MSESVAPASRKSLKVNVESVEIPVEKDGSILLSTLQSAFPGAHGLYFFDGSSKHAVKYDGKDAKIIAPEDGWNERAYYTSLAHSRQAWQPYGSYENASKQFERSVNAVQRMLGGFGR
uniref:TAR DNA-binding protein 43 N-terminal domain-containing protein n=1 Tax=Plectus sambesii TaxID=2011161 RepID=A0A914VQG8_9BILA